MSNMLQAVSILYKTKLPMLLVSWSHECGSSNVIDEVELSADGCLTSSISNVIDEVELSADGCLMP
jgi:hypothetical protein